MSSRKGGRRERELRNYYRLMDGYVAVRMPSSGSGTDMDLPDIIVGGSKLPKPLAGEAKSGASNCLYVTQSEARSLERFAGAFGATPVVFGRWDQDTSHYYTHIDNVRRTESGNLSMKHDVAATSDEWVEVVRPDDY